MIIKTLIFVSIILLKVVFSSENISADLENKLSLSETLTEKSPSQNRLLSCKSFTEKLEYVLMCRALDIDIRVYFHLRYNSGNMRYSVKSNAKGVKRMAFDSKTLTDSIVFNYIQGRHHRDEQSDQTERNMAAKFRIPRHKVFNKHVLAKLTKNRKILHFLGLAQCYKIIRKIITEFHGFSRSDETCDSVRHGIISTDLCDLLEVIFNELLPKYPHFKTSPEFNARHKLNHDNQIFDDFEKFLSTDSIISFRDADLFEMVFVKFRSILNISVDYRSDLCESFHDDLPRYRNMLVVLLRLFPRDFLSGFDKIYASDFNLNPKGPFVLNYMAPILRAFMMIDAPEQLYKYLQEYYGVIRYHTDQVSRFKNRSNLRCLDTILKDSNFLLIRNESARGEKCKLFKVVLRAFYDVDESNIFDFLKRVIPIEGTCFLFEAILQYFSCVLDLQQKADLLVLSLEHSSFDLTKMLIAVSYFDFEASEANFQYLQAGIDNLSERNRSFALESEDQRDFSIYERSIILFFTYSVINDSPIKTARSIIGSEEIRWPCTLENMFTFPENKHIDSYPMLFEYGRVILSKYLNIPLARTAFYDDSRESISWQEMIGFMNFMIERHAVFLALDRENIVRFKDSTEYSPVIKVLESESEPQPETKVEVSSMTKIVSQTEQQ